MFNKFNATVLSHCQTILSRRIIQILFKFGSYGSENLAKYNLAAIPVQCTITKSISARMARGTGGIRSLVKGKGEGSGGGGRAVGPVGTEGPVSLPWDWNTRRIKSTGNQTFQYPCSCRIYAIKRSQCRRPALLPMFLFSARLSLSLTPASCHRTPRSASDV